MLLAWSWSRSLHWFSPALASKPTRRKRQATRQKFSCRHLKVLLLCCRSLERMAMTGSIIGTGQSPYTRHPSPGTTTSQVIARAVSKALHDAGLQTSDVDGFAVSSFTLEIGRAHV